MRSASQPTPAKRAPRVCPLIGCPSLALTESIDAPSTTPSPTGDAPETTPATATAPDTTAFNESDATSPSLLPPSTATGTALGPSTTPATTSEATPSSDPETPAVPTTLFASREIPSRSAKSSPPSSPTSTNGSASAAASVSQGELTAPASPEPSHTPIPGSTGNASPSSSSRSPPPSLGPTTAISSQFHRVSGVPTAALAGAIVAVLLATAAAAVLLWVWLRRRRARARGVLSTTQNGTSAMFPSAPGPAVRERAVSKIQAELEGVRTRALSLVSGSSYDACAGSTTSTETAPAVQTAMDQKGGAPPAPPPCPPPANAEDRGPLGNLGGVVPQSVSASAQEAGVHAGERLLHFALPWAVGQRVLAMMAREDGDGDARSVGSGGSEPLPAYEPRPA